MCLVLQCAEHQIIQCAAKYYVFTPFISGNREFRALPLIISFPQSLVRFPETLVASLIQTLDICLGVKFSLFKESDVILPADCEDKAHFSLEFLKEKSPSSTNLKTRLATLNERERERIMFPKPFRLQS